jgi:hypothetical protein
MTLRITFKSGGVYEFYGVPEPEHKALMRSNSKGRHFNQAIKNAGYRWKQLE